MSTPVPDIVPGDVWETVSALGVGIGAIPAGAQVVISDYLEPFSPGVAQTDEWTAVATYAYTGWGYDDSGSYVEMPMSRRLAYRESVFRTLFQPYEGD